MEPTQQNIIIAKSQALPDVKDSSTFKSASVLNYNIIAYKRERTMPLFSENNYSEGIVIEGLDLTATQMKLVSIFSKILYAKSQTNNPKMNNYFLGNYTPIFFDKEINLPRPALYISIKEIINEYNTNKSKPAASVYKLILEEIENLASLEYNISIYSKSESSNGKDSKEKYIKLYKQRLIDIADAGEKDTIDGTTTIHNERLIILHPIFNSGIDNNFVAKPQDIEARIAAYYNGRKPKKRDRILLNLLELEYSKKRYVVLRDQDTLFKMFSNSKKRKGSINEFKNDLETAVELCKAVGILKEFHEITNKKGLPQYKFLLTEKWT